MNQQDKLIDFLVNKMLVPSRNNLEAAIHECFLYAIKSFQGLRNFLVPRVSMILPATDFSAHAWMVLEHPLRQ